MSMEDLGAKPYMIPIGKMAQMAGVSQRALRLYQKLDLLVPAYVDEESGYRYYASSQIVDLQSIRELQAIGFSLDEIAEHMEGNRVRELRERTLEKVAAIEAQQRELAIARYLAEEMIDRCDFFLRKPLMKEIMVENRSECPIRQFDITDLDISDDISSDDYWFQAYAEVGRILNENEGLALNRNYGGIISEERLKAGRLTFDKLFVYADSELSPQGGEPSCIPAGQYLVMYCGHYITEGGAHAREMANLQTMMQYAEDHDFEVCGAYYDEAILSSSLFGLEGFDSLYKMNLPVHRKGSNSEPCR